MDTVRLITFQKKNESHSNIYKSNECPIQRPSKNEDN
ncbi:MAG: hypothetical protein ACJA08_002817 [Cyclobacteriaceae bacterium]|jgi:hypothetical protein